MFMMHEALYRIRFILSTGARGFAKIFIRLAKPDP
jgi:hypothetical protein